MDSKLKTVQLENDENETIQYLTNELRSNITINRVKDFLNDDYEESIKQLSKLYNAKRFSINLNEFKEEIQELYDNIIDICDDTADIISYDSFIKNSNNALLFIDVPKYLREEKRFDFNFEWYKKLFSVLSIYYGDWILSWKNFVELNKKKNSLYSESRTGDKTIPIEIYAYGVSRDEAEKAGIKQSEGVTEQNQDDTKPEEYESSVNNMDYRTIVEKHPDRYVIAAVAERGENNFVSGWEVLSADSKSFNEAKEKLKFFESEGVKGCCIINTYADASDETEAGAVARMFRLMYGMDMV